MMMGHNSHNHGFCNAGVLRLVLFLLSTCLVCYVVWPPLYWHFTGNLASSCPSCVCDCSLETILSIPLDCGKHGPDKNGEMVEEDIVDLLSEELNLQRSVTNDNIEHTKASILEARKTSSQYQKEAEKCNAGMEACEEAREKAEAELVAEQKLSALWESRAREKGWKDGRKAIS